MEKGDAHVCAQDLVSWDCWSGYLRELPRMMYSPFLLSTDMLVMAPLKVIIPALRLCLSSRSLVLA